MFGRRRYPDLEALGLSCIQGDIRAAEAVRRAGLPAQVRGEALTLAQFAQLADACSEVLAEKRGSENGDAGEEVTP